MALKFQNRPLLFSLVAPSMRDRIPATESSPETGASGRLLETAPNFPMSVATLPGEYGRILVNDALQHLEFCAADGIGVGMYTLSEFVENQSYARHSDGNDCGKCYT
ncbi:hypothetical protein B0H11DRAFT_2239920 [Mycena galericulata]|nr:hypothetical protein B0H11DRAFT_2239920 [Mycena galericulata]